MKVLMLNYEFPPLGGGTANANRYLLKEFSSYEDLEIDLVTSSRDSYQEEEFSENITIYRLDVSKDEIHRWTQMEILRYMWKGFRKSRELKEKNDYDIVHAWSGFPCGVMAKMLGLKYLVALRGSDVPGFNQRFSWHYVLLRPLIKSVWKSAEDIIPNSEGLKDLAQETLDTEMTVIPNGIDVSEFKPDYNPEGQLKVLVVSRLIERKRVQDVLRAVKNLDVELTVIGDGSRKPRLQKLAAELGIEERVNFEGHVEHTEIARYYSDSDIFVLPSLNEGMSNAVLEAMASGLPVIVTDTGGTRELVEDNGRIVPEKSPGKIREALERYIENPDLLEMEGRKSREKAEQMSWEKVAQEYTETYKKYHSSE